ncbi:MAG: acetyltransferase [Candidatus Omnitrophota bacterium]
MENIAIIGSGGYAYAVKDIVCSLGIYVFKGFVGKEGDSASEYNETNLKRLKDDNIFCLVNGVGNISYPWFERMIMKYQAGGFRFPPIVHPSSVVSKSSKVGDGSVVFENAVIKSNSFVEQFCIINSLSVVSHDCKVGDYSHISLGAKTGGGCEIGKNSFLGINSSVIQGKKIGDNVIIGAGAVVISDIPDGVVAVGNPAKVIKRR